MKVSRILGWLSAAFAAALPLFGHVADAAAQSANKILGQPAPWEMVMQQHASPVGERLGDFHTMLLWIITAIVIFVMVLMGIVIVRFNEKSNPVPSKTSHHTLIEIAWTVVPVMILVAIAIPSFKLLYYLDSTPNAEMTIKVTGHQWYWQYEYPDNGNFTFDSYMVPVNELKPDQLRLLDVDNRIVIPVDTTVRVLVTSADVMHSWFVPSLGLQRYATPGRINEAWVKATKEGVFYGQCNQICGVNHAFMPIAVQAIAKDKFQAWVDEAKKKYAANGADPIRVAAAGQ